MNSYNKTSPLTLSIKVEQYGLVEDLKPRTIYVLTFFRNFFLKLRNISWIQHV